MFIYGCNWRKQDAGVQRAHWQGVSLPTTRFRTWEASWSASALQAENQWVAERSSARRRERLDGIAHASAMIEASVEAFSADAVSPDELAVIETIIADTNGFATETRVDAERQVAQLDERALPA